MVKKGRKRGTLTVSIKTGDRISKVFLAGDFTDWKPLPMRRRGGVFSLTVAVPPGRHEYKFILDGHWRADPEPSGWVMNPYGTLNSVVTVETEGRGGATPGAT